MISVGIVDGRATSELRRAVLRPHFPVGTPMHGDDDPSAVHVAAVEDGEVISTCWLLPNRCPAVACPPDLADDAWQLRGMATAESVRGRGLGGQVLAEALAEVARRDVAVLWLQARERAIDFYRRHGFVGDGEIYLHPDLGIPHLLMWRELDPPTTSSA